MPEPINNGGGAGGDEAAAKAAADKATADAAAAAAAAGNGSGAGEETVTIKKSDLKKIEEDRDNYKAGLLAKKADERNLGGDGKGAGDGKGGEGAGQGGGSATIDEKKVGEIATASTTKVLRDASEKTAKRAFLKAH